MKFEIKSRWTGNVLFVIEAGCMRLAVEAAVKTGADLRGADLTPIRDDLWAVLSAVPREVEGLRTALIAGKVDGSTYSGECACLVGTIANVRHVDYTSLGALKPNSNRPIERFFLSIKQGDTPEANAVSKLVLGWIDEWLTNVKGAFLSETTGAQ